MTLDKLRRRHFDSRPLVWQFSLLILAPALLVAALLHGVAHVSGEVIVAVLVTAVLAALAAGALAWRLGRVLRELASGIHTLRRSPAAAHEINVPLLGVSAELQRASAALRRLIEVWRRRQLQLIAQTETLGRRLALRTHELTTLQDLAIGLASKSELRELIDEALGALEQTMAYSSASVWSRLDRASGGKVVLMGYRQGDMATAGLSSGEDLTGMRLSRANLQRYEQIERDGRPIVENRVRQSLLSWLWSWLADDARTSGLYRGTKAWMAVPLKSRETIIGVLRVDHDEPDYFDDERVRLLSAVASQTGLAMRHAQLLAQQKDMAVVAERSRIARDLHDAVSQTLFAANVLAGTLVRLSERIEAPESAAIRAQATALERLNKGALAEMRLLMFELRPDALQATPLADLLQQAIEALACRGTIDITQRLAPHDRLPSATRVQIYRIAQEALSNIGRHSCAQYALVEWVVGDDGRGGRLRIVDDHPMIRTGLAAMIEGETDFEHVGEAAHGADAVRMIPALAPDVVLLDLLMPQMDGVETMTALRPLVPQTRFIVLTSLAEPAQVQRALAAGAAGYLTKTASAQELVNVIRAAHGGRRVLSPEATEALISASHQHAPGSDLTQRERELLTLMARGLSNQDIAEQLHIALPTVKFHITNILGKLGASNRTEAVLTALKHRLVAAS
jgi:NarL family two-component system response regulator LiaR